MFARLQQMGAAILTTQTRASAAVDAALQSTRLERQRARDEAAFMREVCKPLVTYDVVAEIALYTEQQQQKRQRAETIEPTPERMAKGDMERVSQSTAVGQERRETGHHYQSKIPVDVVRKYIEADEFEALSRFAVNAEFASRTRAITGNYEGSPGGAFGPRHGGLPDRFREAASVHDWMQQKMHPNFRRFAAMVFHAVQRERDGRPMTPREIMQHFLPLVRSEARKDGGFLALFRAFSWRLQELEQDLNNAIAGTTRGGETIRSIITAERAAKGRKK